MESYLVVALAELEGYRMRAMAIQAEINIALGQSVASKTPFYSCIHTDDWFEEKVKELNDLSNQMFSLANSLR